MDKLEILISNKEEGNRIDLFLASVLEKSRSAVQQLIKKEDVTIDGKPCKANLILKEGQQVTVILKEPVETEILPENIPIEVLYEDSDIIVVNKPRGMVVHPAIGNLTGTLVNALLYHCKDLSGVNGEIRPGIVHRLDKDTSGVMVAAKNDAAHLGLAEQIKAHSASRTYRAIVNGNIEEERGTIKAPIGRHSKDRVKMAVVFSNSKDAVTHFTVLERFGAYTMIQCQLETGRTHQIRVHMAYIDHPVVNDPLYGYKKKLFPINGQALHSETLDLVHPTTGVAMHFVAPLPQDMLDCIEYAQSHRGE